ncbi:MAG: hypothetical protein COA78_22740 [Blastopirellula sp.]|nr:MAG: hypothetical protein COA78_22740 [Blastopirellula sp.]
MTEDDQQNPYRSPVDAETEPTDTTSIPGSVAFVFVSGFFLLLIQFTEAGYLVWRQQNINLAFWLFPAVPLLLLISLAFGGKVAWACSRYYFGFSFLLGTGIFIVRVISSGDDMYITELALLCSQVANLVIFLSLGHPKSRAYFQMICPVCNTDYPQPADWLCAKTTCRKCGHQW